MVLGSPPILQPGEITLETKAQGGVEKDTKPLYHYTGANRNRTYYYYRIASTGAYRLMSSLGDGLVSSRLAS